MGLFQKKIGPVFLKENSEVSEFISKMVGVDIYEQFDLYFNGNEHIENIGFYI